MNIAHVGFHTVVELSVHLLFCFRFVYDIGSSGSVMTASIGAV